MKKQGSGVGSFKQQDLKAFQPVLTPVALMGMLLFVFVVFLPIGIVLVHSSNQVIEQSVRYDNIPQCFVDSTMNYSVLPRECVITMTIENDMKAPIYFYYELRDFYQNHRRYLSSKSDRQLRGDGNADLDKCDPIMRYSNRILVPCGLSAASFFEDRFRMSINGEELCNSTVEANRCHNWGSNNSQQWQQNWDKWHQKDTWDMDDIAWNSDDDKFKFVQINSNSESQFGYRQKISGLRLPDINNKDFIVWMRTAALPNFRKLHRVIKTKDILKNDNVTITILNWFPTSDFDGQKWVTLATAEWSGGRNHGLAWTYIVVACVAIALTVTFAILLLFGSRKMADIDRFKWYNRPRDTALVSIG